MFNNSERNILIIVRYAPIILILILSILTTVFIKKSHQINLNEEINRITKFYIDFNKIELEEEVDRIYSLIEKEDKQILVYLKASIKDRVYQAHQIANKIYQDNKHNKSDEEILLLIRTALGSIIFNNGRGFYFIYNTNGINLLQPLNKKVENTNILEFEDINGYKFVKTITQSIKDKTEQFDSYYWTKNSNDPVQYKKISFYKYFEPLNISIGTGEYVKDFEKEIKQKVINDIQDIKLNDDGYIFLINYQGDILAHKNKRTITKNLLNMKDKNGLEIIKEAIKIAKSGKGQFISYYNSTLDEEAFLKTSYIRGYNKWGWTFGTGYSEKDLLNIIADTKKELLIKNQEYLYQLILTNFIITLFLIILSLFASKYLQRIFRDYKIKIEEEEKDFKTLFESSDIGLAICDGSGRFINVNSKLLEMLEYKDKNNILNKTWQEVSHTTKLSEEYQVYKDLLTQQIDSYTIEKRYIKENNEILEAYVTAKILKTKKKIKYILFSVIDITKIKEKDRLFFQQSKMAAMGEMIANITHQWKQPLSLISTASTGMLLQKEHDILTDDFLKESLKSITKSTQYLSSTMDDFKNFFKPKENSEIFSLRQMFDKTLDFVSSQFKNLDIEVIQDIHDINIISYENELIQVFINILNNAKDALANNDNKKLILISTKLSKNNKKLVISIKDSAGGIPSDIINKVFEPYITTKSNNKGTGIGLYMVKEIIKKHMEGTIKVKNTTFIYCEQSYTGAEFKIFIPLA